MTEEELAAIRARAEAATAGPWYGGLGEVFSDVEHWSWMPNQEYYVDQENADAAFIAYARADIPRLLDEVARLRAIADAAQGLLNTVQVSDHDIRGTPAYAKVRYTRIVMLQEALITASP